MNRPTKRHSSIERKSHRKSHRKSARKSHRKSHRKSARKSHRKSARKSHRKSHRKSRRISCKEEIRRKIPINMLEYRNGLFKSPKQAIAVSYAQVLKQRPHCKSQLRRRV